ncbi:hypothetical protein WDM22_42270 [Bradyrhizobium septentrionale]
MLPESVASNSVWRLMCARIWSPVDGAPGFFTGASVIEFHPFSEFGLCETRQTTQRPNKRPIGRIDDRDSFAPFVEAQTYTSELLFELSPATGILKRFGQQHPQSRQVKTLTFCDLVILLGETPAMIEFLRLEDVFGLEEAIGFQRSRSSLGVGTGDKWNTPHLANQNRDLFVPGIVVAAGHHFTRQRIDLGDQDMKMLRASIRGSVLTMHPDHGLLGIEAEFCS